MALLKNFFIIFLTYSFTFNVDAKSCKSVVEHHYVPPTSWSKSGVLIGIEVLAAAKVAKLMRKRSYNPIGRFRSPDRFESSLRRIWARDNNSEPELIVNDEDYEGAKVEAVNYITSSNRGVSIFSPADVKREFPVIAKFFGDDFLNYLSDLTLEDRDGVREFMSANIDAILINAVAFPQSGRIQRMGYAVRVNTTKYIIPGVCTALGCVAGAAAFSFGSQELASITDSLLIEDIGLGLALTVGGIGGLASSYFTLRGTVSTPLYYLNLKSTPGYNPTLYNHKIGQSVRDEFSKE